MCTYAVFFIMNIMLWNLSFPHKNMMISQQLEIGLMLELR